MPAKQVRQAECDTLPPGSCRGHPSHRGAHFLSGCRILRSSPSRPRAPGPRRAGRLGPSRPVTSPTVVGLQPACALTVYSPEFFLCPTLPRGVRRGPEDPARKLPGGAHGAGCPTSRWSLPPSATRRHSCLALALPAQSFPFPPFGGFQPPSGPRASATYGPSMGGVCWPVTRPSRSFRKAAESRCQVPLPNRHAASSRLLGPSCDHVYSALFCELTPFFTELCFLRRFLKNPCHG